MGDLVERAKALPRPASPGPWSWKRDSRYGHYVGSATGKEVCDCDGYVSNNTEQDAKSIAALPDALAIIDELVAEVGRLRMVLAVHGLGHVILEKLEPGA